MNTKINNKTSGAGGITTNTNAAGNDSHIREKLIEALIDIGKTCVYLIGGIALLHFSDDKIVDYLDKIEKLKALREASLEYKNESLESSKRLVRAAKRLQYSTYALEDHPDSSATIGSYERKFFRENAEEFLATLRIFLSYSTDLSLRETATSLSQSVESILDTLSGKDQSSEDYKVLKINLAILESKLAKFVLTITQ